MKYLLKATGVLFILWFPGSILKAQIFENSILRKYDNFQKIRWLEDQYSVDIFYDSAALAKALFNDLPLGAGTIEDAFEALLNDNELTFRKLQETSYVLMPVEAVRNITEKMDTLTGYQDGSIMVGNIASYKKNKAAAVSGVVLDGKSGQPLPGAMVAIRSLELGAVSDGGGEFKLSLKPGNYVTQISCVGYEEFTTTLKVLSSGSVIIELFEKSIRIEEVNVYAKRADRNITSDKMSLVEIDKKSIKQLPLVTGEKDLIRSFSMLPGIKSTGEFGTGISVRGGGNDQNLFLLEETQLYNTSHVFGLISAISPDIVSNVSLYKGFIPPEFGERASSVVDIQARRGNEKKYAASGGIGVFSSRLAVEGPIVKDKVSFLVAGRSSYSDWLLNYMPDVQLANSDAKFYDLYAGVHAKLNNKNRLYGMFYTSYDFFNYNKLLHYSNANTSGELKWNYARSSSVDYSLALAFSNNGIGKDDLEYAAMSYHLQNAVNSVSLRGDVAYSLNRHHAIKAGVQAIRYTLRQGEQEPWDSLSAARTIELETNKGLETALYLNDNVTLNSHFSLNLGLRYSMFFNLGPYTVYNYRSAPYSDATLFSASYYKNNELIKMYHGPEPRFSFRYQMNNSSSAKVSYSRNIQYLSLVSASAVQSPDDIWQLANTYIEPIISNAYAAGLYKNFKQNTFETSVEFYYRSLKNLTDYKNGARLTLDTWPDSLLNMPLANMPLETELINAIGRNYGVEIMLKKNLGSLEGWIAYTYSRSLKKTHSDYAEEIIRGNEFYPSSYDKPHDLNTMLTYHYNRRLRFTANFTYSTGRAVTLPEAIYFIDNTWNITYRPRNSERLPDYHRLDLSVSLDESLRIKKKWKGSWTFSVLNVYGRKNAYSVFFKSEVPTEENNYRSFGLYKLYIIGRPLPTLTYNFIF
ncbi:MAG: TonB-dependent receptor plug [Bacteroidetes bacterium]|nr:TonB-dependent receptor plug [Bacteroidota bacterium]